MSWNNRQKTYFTMRCNRLNENKVIRCDFSLLSTNWCKERGHEGRELRWLGNTKWLLCKKHFIECGGEANEWEERENYKESRR